MQKLISHSDLIDNYIQATPMRPDRDLTALQTSDGFGLIFSIGDGDNGDVLNVTCETSNQSVHGWNVVSLSDNQVKSDFPKQIAAHTKVNCKKIAAGQTSAGMGLAMVLRDEAAKTDHLYLCLNQIKPEKWDEVSWLKDPRWVYFEFDEMSTNTPVDKNSLNITNLFLGQNELAHFVCLDVAGTDDNTYRYYIDESGESGSKWQQITFNADIDPKKSSITCTGRPDKDMDGIYTTGKSSADTVLMYAPVVKDDPRSSDGFSLKPPSPATDISAIAAYRRDDGKTDLFVTANVDGQGHANGGLYCYRADDQADDAQPTLLLTNELFIEMSQLHVLDAGDQILLWGLNHALHLFYLTILKNDMYSGDAWQKTRPYALRGTIEQATPYVNLSDANNPLYHIFTKSNNQLAMLSKSPGNQRLNKPATMWRQKPVHMPTTDTAYKFTSYTTVIQLAQGKLNDDSDDKTIVPADPDNLPWIELSASTRIGCYLNNLYTVLAPEPQKFQLDTGGKLIIIEDTDNSLHGTEFTTKLVTADYTLYINPMDKAFNRAAGLDLKTKSVPLTYKEDPAATPRPLVSPGTNTDQVGIAQSALGVMKNAYPRVSPALAGGHRPLNLSSMAMATGVPWKDIEGALKPEFSELYNMFIVSGAKTIDLIDDAYNRVKDAVGDVIGVVESAVEGAWYFVAKIAGQVFQCALDIAEKVMGAIEWLVSAIGTALKDLLLVLQFLFELKSITRTKEVIQTVIEKYLDFQIGRLDYTKNLMIAAIDGAKTEFGKMIGDKSKTFPDLSSGQTADLGVGHTYIQHHYQANASGITEKTAPSGDGDTHGTPNPIADLMAGLESAVTDLYTGFTELGQEFTRLSIAEILEKIAGIIINGALDLTKGVASAIFDMLIVFADLLKQTLEYKIHIPVVSDILNDFGIPDFSLLEIICFIAAVPATLVYVDLTGNPPFADDTIVSTIKNQDFTVQAPPAAQHLMQTRPGDGPPVVNPNVEEKILFGAGLDRKAAEGIYAALYFTAGICGFINTIVSSLITATNIDELPRVYAFKRPASVAGLIGGIASLAAGCVIGIDGYSNPGVRSFYYSMAACRVLFQALANGPIMDKFAPNTKLDPKSAAFFDMVLVIPAVICSIYHCVQLAGKNNDNDKTIAVLGETGNFVSYINRVINARVTFSPPTTEQDRLLTAGAMFGTGCFVATIPVVQAAIYIYDNK